MKISILDNIRYIYLSKKEFEKLETFLPNYKGPINEGLFKLFEFDGTIKLIKAFYYNANLSTVISNLNILITYREILNESLPYLVLPEDYVYIKNPKNLQTACTMKRIKGITLEDILSEETYSPKKKIQLLKSLGKIIEKFGKIPNFPYKMYFGDLHEGNIMITGKKGIKIVDTTSLFIESKNAIPMQSKYLELNSEIQKSQYRQKYRKHTNDAIIPDKNTDIFCYTYIILNTLAGTDISVISLKDLYNYLDFLEYLKVNKDFLFCVTRLFSEGDNINPHNFISSISSKQLRKANYLSYKNSIQ